MKGMFVVINIMLEAQMLLFELDLYWTQNIPLKEIIYPKI